MTHSSKREHAPRASGSSSDAATDAAEHHGVLAAVAEAELARSAPFDRESRLEERSDRPFVRRIRAGGQLVEPEDLERVIRQ